MADVTAAVLTSDDCSAWGCTQTAEADGLCREHLERKRPLGSGEPPIGAGASPEPSAPEPEPEPATEETTMEKHTASTRDSLIAEIKAYAAEHDGAAPKSHISPGSRIYNHARKLGLVYADLVEAAGLERPVGGQKKNGTPKPAKPAVPPPVAETNGTTPDGIAQLAARFEETATALEIAQEDYEVARVAFFAHPLIVATRNTHG